MQFLLGEYDCKMDEKGRLRMPSGLLKQFESAVNGRFVINRGFENCLALYPYPVWEEMAKKVNKLNTFDKKNRQFVRAFYRGAPEVNLDSSDRINFPKQLLAFAGIEKDLILTAQSNYIEIWDKTRYEESMDIDSDDWSDLAEAVMGNTSDKEED